MIGCDSEISFVDGVISRSVYPPLLSIVNPLHNICRWSDAGESGQTLGYVYEECDKEAYVLCEIHRARCSEKAKGGSFSVDSIPGYTQSSCCAYLGSTGNHGGSHRTATKARRADCAYEKSQRIPQSEAPHRDILSITPRQSRLQSKVSHATEPLHLSVLILLNLLPRSGNTAFDRIRSLCNLVQLGPARELYRMLFRQG